MGGCCDAHEVGLLHGQQGELPLLAHFTVDRWVAHHPTLGVMVIGDELPVPGDIHSQSRPHDAKVNTLGLVGLWLPLSGEAGCSPPNPPGVLGDSVGTAHRELSRMQ